MPQTLPATAPLLTADSAAPALELEHLTHIYPAARTTRRRGRGVPEEVKPADATPATPRRGALDDVTFAVRPGEIFGILGPNGGGKTTLFRILTTLLRPTEGTVRIFGQDVQQSPAAVRSHLGVVFQMPSLDVKLTARENLMHQGHLYGLSGQELRDRSEALLTYFGLSDRADEYVERFSGGMRRRVEVAKALLHRPRLLLLDEPSTGLDPGARADLMRYLERLREAEHMTIVMTTHLMDEADRCDRLAILARGQLMAVDTPDKLKARIGGDVIIVDPVTRPGHAAEDAAALCAELTEQFGPWPDGRTPRVADGKIYLERAEGAAFVAKLAAALGDRARSITVGQPTLEDVFLHLTGHRLWG